MLKPKYVHGLNAEEAPVSLLHRLQHGEGVQFIPILPPNPDDTGGDAGPPGNGINWAWTLG